MKIKLILVIERRTETIEDQYILVPQRLKAGR